MSRDNEEDTGTYMVVKNEEDQYSIWSEDWHVEYKNEDHPKCKNKIAKLSNHRLCCIFDRRIQAVLRSCYNSRKQILVASRQARLSWKHPRNAAPLYL